MTALLFFLFQDPVTVTVSGRAEFDGVVRGGALNEASVWIPGGLPDGSDLDNTDTLISPKIRLRFDIEFSTELAAVIELGNQQLNFDSGIPILQNQRLGDDDTLVLVRQAFIQVRRWPADVLDWQVGAMEFSLGGENPLFLSSDSESPWGEIPDSTVPPFPPAGTSTVPQTRRDELQPGGFLMRFSHEGFRGSLWLFPAVIEGGRAKDDEAIYGLDLSVDFDNFTVGILGALFAGDGRVGTFGAWVRVEIGIFDGMLEAYTQTGEVDPDLDAEGWAFRADIRFRFDADWRPWLALHLAWVSGDDDGLDGEEGRFLSYENNDATPLVEGNEFGLDIDSNYRSIRFSGGLSIHPFEDLPRIEIWTSFAFFSLLEEIPLPPDPVFAISGRSDDLGVEWDLGIRMPWSKSLQTDATIAFLLGADVLEEFTRKGEDSAFLIILGSRLQF